MTVLKDMNRMGPAPTWERELAAAAANLLLTLVAAGLLVFVFGSVLVAGLLAVLGVVWIAVRLVLAHRRRDGTEADR